jgi:hypothetical protein
MLSAMVRLSDAREKATTFLLFRSSQTSATSSQTCPLCRVDITGDSGFLLAETPKYDNVKKMLTESILSLPVDYKSRSHDSPSMTRSHRE